MSHTATDDPPRHRYTVADYRRMGETGILAPDARVELIDGDIIDMAPIGPSHVSTVLELDYLLKDAVKGQALVLVQGPILLSDYSAPEPDFALLEVRTDFYRSALPRPDDVLLVIEVAQSSLRHDCNVKLSLYARHAIREFWLIDLEAGQLLRHRQPDGERYTVADRPALDSPLPIDALPGVTLDLSRLLPARDAAGPFSA